MIPVFFISSIGTCPSVIEIFLSEPCSFFNIPIWTTARWFYPLSLRMSPSCRLLINWISRSSFSIGRTNAFACRSSFSMKNLARFLTRLLRSPSRKPTTTFQASSSSRLTRFLWISLHRLRNSKFTSVILFSGVHHQWWAELGVCIIREILAQLWRSYLLVGVILIHRVRIRPKGMNSFSNDPTNDCDTSLIISSTPTRQLRAEKWKYH